MLNTFKIEFKGRVQGVGFRPHVAKLAKKLRLTGNVSNHKEGVIIHVNGTLNEVENFYDTIVQSPPLLARIREHSLKEIEGVSYKKFDIVPTEVSGNLNLALTPDFGICDACKEEISDPENRRYQYPFTTCVNCGPRWSITNTFPFERAHTTMDKFTMCSNCESEYGDVEERRFHSQTNSCPTCGIQLELHDDKGIHLEVAADKILQKAADLIRKGKILAVKNTGGYLLCCDAGDPDTINRLRELKRRPKKPFAILYPSIERLKEDLPVKKWQAAEMSGTERPIVIMSGTGFKGNLALEEIAPGLNQLGVMLPNSGLMHLLSRELGQPMVATSGNIHGCPVICDNERSIELISEVADYFLHHNLEISNAQDDSVVKFSQREHQRIMFRRSRGFAPNFLDYSPLDKKRVLALGGHLKSTIAFAPNDYLYLSQYLGNLDHFEVYNRFEETVTRFLQIFNERPQVILVDQHPDYASTRYGQELSKQSEVPLYSVQHHRAHFASVLGEHELFGSDEKILGVVWDGTGLGEDGQIWGGEFFSYQAGEMSRTGHFDYFNWLAGDKMAREPRLSLLSLHEDKRANMIGKKFSENEHAIYSALIARNGLKTSSVGRLFDAVASLLNLCDINTYEGEAAVLLENRVMDYDLVKLKGYASVRSDLKVPTLELWQNLYKDFCAGERTETIILNFIYTLARLVVEMGALTGSHKIALSGGVFQNAILVDMVRELARNRYELYFNQNLAPNDENISYGQLMYYSHILRPEINKKYRKNLKSSLYSDK